MARPLRRDAQRNRELVIDAAREVFAERGVEAPLEEVARRAGVSIGTLYNRFPTRVDLIDAVFAEVVRSAIAMAKRALAEPDPWQGLVVHLEAMARMQASDRGFTDVCSKPLPPDTETERAKIVGHGLMQRIVERAQDAGALRSDVTPADIGLLLWGVVNATVGVREAAPNAWRRHVAIMLDGLRAQAAHPLPGAPLEQHLVANAMSFGG